MKTKTKKLNVKLLNKIKAHIAAEPKRLDMGWGLAHVNKSAVPCGTVGCIAGWAVALSGAKLPFKLIDPDDNPVPVTDSGVRIKTQVDWDQARQLATELLKLDAAQAESLFYAWNWPTDFREAYGYDDDYPRKGIKMAKQRVKATCDRIDHLIATGE